MQRHVILLCVTVVGIAMLDLTGYENKTESKISDRQTTSTMSSIWWIGRCSLIYSIIKFFVVLKIVMYIVRDCGFGICLFSILMLMLIVIIVGLIVVTAIFADTMLTM